MPPEIPSASLSPGRYPGQACSPFIMLKMLRNWRVCHAGILLAKMTHPVLYRARASSQPPQRDRGRDGRCCL